jgi:hypothetical protein
MQTVFGTSLLKFALVADAVASGAAGVLLAAGAGYLTGWLGLPEPLMRYAGLFLLPYALFVAWVGLRSEIPRGATGLIAAANIGWCLGSFALLASGLVNPSALGQLFVGAQAVVVGAFAMLQIAGLRNSAASQPA